MEPILRIIAREYSSRYPNLKNICFLFPNKRCGTFLRKYFAEFEVFTEDLPHILTISELVSQVARKFEAGKIEQLFVLYKAYVSILGHDPSKKDVQVEFEAFRNWGETVIADFNTIDLNLVESSQIFKNIKDFREITSNFLSEEQKEVMKEYFGIEAIGDDDEFWKSFADPQNLSSLKKEFLNLWQILSPLYKEFISKLAERGLGTTGSIYKEATHKILEKGREVFPYKKLVAVGFNALTESERTIFRKLKQSPGYEGYDEFIDFIWDATGPILCSNNFTASKFLNYNKKHFPLPSWLIPTLDKNSVSNYPEIEIISAPSNTSQAKVATEILESYKKESEINLIKEAKVALVLPDESLLPNVLFSIPDRLGDINLTMGISLRQTPIASFMSLFRRLYSSSRESSSGINFYARDLKMFFSHPYSLRLFDPGEVETALGMLIQKRKISVKNSELEYILTGADTLLAFPSKKNNGNEVFDFLDKIFEKLLASFSTDDVSVNLQALEQITIYKEYIDDLYETIKQYHMEFNPISILQLIDRLISSEKIGFEGEPLTGLQIMGTLETRTLDFKHVIILSMNEGIMPRKALAPSFIPETLRNAYGLPPARYAEEIFSYYFYRLISRAEKVSLIFDARTISGLRGGESRYLLQLKHFVPSEKIKFTSWQYRMQNRQPSNASITKTPEIKTLIKTYETQDDSRKNFSASSLNNYRECEVKFFLRNVLNLETDPEQGEYMDAISIGDVLHETMLDLYMPEKFQRRLLEKPLVIDSAFLRSLLDDKTLIHNSIIKNINKIYYGLKEPSTESPESGVAEIISDQIEEIVRQIIEHDLSIAPFHLYGCEISKNIRVTLSSGRIVNFRFAIDRLDEILVNGVRRLRVVDYKTGKRKRKAENLEEVFNGGYNSEQIFQLFTYAWLLGKIGMKGWKDVMTEIYFVPDFVKGERGLPELEGEKIETFEPYAMEFSERLEQMIESVFSSPIFNQPSNNSVCSYCDYKSFCSK